MYENSDDLKTRMIAAKKEIPMPFMSVYEFQFGGLDKKQKSKVRNVWNLRLVDETIVENFEKLAKKAK